MQITHRTVWLYTHRTVWLYPALIAFVATLMSPLVLAQQPSLTVTVGGVRSQKGNVAVCLWQRQNKDFPICSSTAALRHTTVEATASTVTVTFQNVSPGEYAVSAFHDENQDGKLNRGFMGRPKEGIALSNGDFSKGDQGRPSFDKSRFTVNGAKTISLTLKYL